MTAGVPLGVVAGGHPATADAGAEALRAGGNAADAVVAAAAAAMTAEACLTGLGAGGFALVREPGGSAELLDFFVTAPGLGLSNREREARSRVSSYEVPFRSTTQVFKVGPASCAVPGMPLGLVCLHERHGRLPLPEVLAPAIRLARQGAILVPQQDYLHEILEGILTGTSGMRALFAPEGRLLLHGERIHAPDLAQTLGILAAHGAEPFVRGEYARRITEQLRETGGLITMDDLAAYDVVRRTPVEVRYRNRRVLTNPQPSSGGTLIAFSLSLLARLAAAELPHPQRFEALVRVMEETEIARRGHFDIHLQDPDFTRGFLSSPNIDRYESRIRHGSLLGNTTHVCAIDADGLAVSMTSSCGSGSGVVVEGTGIILNNMMGEEDLNPGGLFSLPPGERLTSMMAPTIACGPRECEHDLVALGSAGSERLRSAIVQTLFNIVEGGLPVQPAIDAPRVHLDRGVVHLEPGIPEEVSAHLEASGRMVRRWPTTALYFGGVQAVASIPDEGAVCFDGGGDPRRGGAAIVV
ncbi:MAG: gamma-glutamyltransferase [Gemmatimonadetes bacterium]|nr:gamma-glutamyltransferase [Gemmatimonadota bacterium]